jgi:hypothetical protein
MRVKALSTVFGSTLSPDIVRFSDAIISAEAVVGRGDGRGGSGMPIDTAAAKVTLAIEFLFGAATGTFVDADAVVVGVLLSKDS